MVIRTSFAGLLLLLSSPSDVLPKDIFALDQALKTDTSLERLTADLLLGRPKAAARLESALAGNRTAPAEDRLKGYLQLCGAYFREQLHADGARTCGAAEEIKKGSAGNLLDLHRLLVEAGPMRWSADAVRIPLQGGQTTVAQRGEGRVEALVDSGAEIAILSPAAAKTLDARPLGSALNLTTTTSAIAGGLVRIDGVRVGDATLSNIVAVILPEEQARYAGIELILPLPALTYLGRAAYTDGGKTLLLGRAAPDLGAARAPLYWDESGVGFGASFSGALRGVHLDTGSKRTWLFPAAASALSPAEQATRQPHRRTIGGLGGERIEDAALFHGVSLGIGGKTWRHPEIEMAAADENGEAARIGTNLFERFRTVVLDFRRMQMSVAE